MPSHPCRLFRGANKINTEDTGMHSFQTCNDLVMRALRDDSGLLQVWHRQDPSRFPIHVFFHQGALASDIRWLGPLCLNLAPLNVIHGITTLSSSILSTHPMGDCSHVGLTQALSFKSGTRVLVNPLVSFQHSQYMR